MKNKFNNENGSVILWTMMFIAIFLLIASTITVLTIADIRQSTKIDSSTAAYLVAEAGVERAKNYAGSSFFDPINPSNPATGVKDTGTKPGQINGNTYTFQVVKAAAETSEPYDSPQRNCDNSGAGVTTAKYCYYSQAEVGGIRRKIDGQYSDVSPSQSKGINLYNMTRWPPPIEIATAPAFDSSYVFTEPTSANNIFTLKGTIEEVSGGFQNEHIFGLTDNASGIGIRVDDYQVTLVDRSNTGANLTNPISISGMTSAKFILTYRTGGVSPTVSLMISDGSVCKGVETTFGYSGSFVPTHIFSNGTITDGAIFDSTIETTTAERSYDDLYAYYPGTPAIIRVALSNGSSFTSDNQDKITNFGDADWTMIPGDYNGDGKTDIAAYKGSSIYVATSNGSLFSTSDFPGVFNWGGGTWRMMAGNFNGTETIVTGTVTIGINIRNLFFEYR